MRLQLLPLALCLFFAFLAPGNNVFAHTEVSEKITEATVNTTFKTKAKKVINKDRMSKVGAISDTEYSGNSTVKYTSGVSSNETTKYIFEENSYEFSSKVRPVLENNAKRSDTEMGQDLIVQTASFGDGMFYGFAIMVILLNLVCYFLFDEKLFLFYSLSLITVSTLLFFSDGLLPLIGFTELSASIILESVLVWTTCLFGAWFASRYLNIPEVFPKLRWVSFLLFSTSTIMILMSWLSGTEVFATVANVLSFTVISLYFLAGVYLFSKKNYPKFYVIAYSIPLLFAIDYFVFRNMGIEFLMTQPGHIKAAVLAEMLLISYAIVYRMKAIKEENELRQTELRIFLKRQEVMNRKNAMQLMEEVYLENLIMHYDLDGFEIKLLQYISEGKENTKIARKLKTTETEIEELTKDLYHKLEISEHIQEDYRMVDAQADYIYN